jgi:hypothetical protein
MSLALILGCESKQSQRRRSSSVIKEARSFLIKPFHEKVGSQDPFSAIPNSC